MATRRILIVEDNSPDVYLIREALSRVGLGGHIQVTPDGESAWQFFADAEADAKIPCPDVVILDINLPKRKGGDVLRQIRANGRCASVKVVVVTSSDSARDREEMTRLGADMYFRKPSDYAEFMKLGPVVRTLLDEDSENPR